MRRTCWKRFRRACACHPSMRRIGHLVTARGLACWYLVLVTATSKALPGRRRLSRFVVQGPYICTADIMLRLRHRC